LKVECRIQDKGVWNKYAYGMHRRADEATCSQVWSTRRQDSKLIDVCTANSVGFTQTKKCINQYKGNPAVSLFAVNLGPWCSHVSLPYQIRRERC